MEGVSQRRSAEFYEWEARCRGFRVWPYPVEVEPPFAPPRQRAPAPFVDAGRKQTALSGFLRRASDRLAPPPVAAPAEPDPEEAPSPFERGEVAELQARLPQGVRSDFGGFAALFSAVSVAAQPLAFEVVATEDRIVAQFAASPRDAGLVTRQLAAHFPEVPIRPEAGFLARAWGEPGAGAAGILEFGLGKEAAIPFQQPRGEPLVALLGALDGLAEGEAAVLQVIFSPARAPWARALEWATSHADGSPLFVNGPELPQGARAKAAQPLFAAVVRLAVRTEDYARTWDIACDAAGALGAYGSAAGNELIPLRNDQYPLDAHEADLLLRQTRRSGMILSAPELAAFAHFPGSEAKSPKLRKAEPKTKPAPERLTDGDGVRIGTNEHHGEGRAVYLSDEDRVRHCLFVGASGTGKSTLLFNLAREAIERGEGLTLIEPHGDLADRVLAAVPPARRSDVILLDPADGEHVVPFNPLSASSDAERSVIASDMVAVFRRLSSAWGDQLNSVLSNALLAFLENDRGGTLHDVRRFLIEPKFREEVLRTVRDPDIEYYWKSAFPLLSGNKSVGPIITRLDSFLGWKPIRYMVSHGESRVDFREVMDSGKILVARLSQGAIGKDNAHLLGSLIVAKMQAEAMSRQRMDEAARRLHWLMIDECSNFLTPSLTDSLTGARKYRLAVLLATQGLAGFGRDPELESAVMGAHVRVAFRVGDADARALEKGFSGFDSADLQSLPTGRAVCRVGPRDADFNLAVDPPRYPGADDASAAREAAAAASRGRYAVPRAEVEAKMRATLTPRPQPSPLASGPATEQAAAPPPTVSSTPPPAPRPPEPLPDLGKGGEQHRAIQERIKEAAEALGFRAEVEKPVAGGAGQVDLVLTRGSRSIACEVSVTTTLDHEVGNVSKCLKAGFARVAVVSPSAEKLAKLRAAVENSLGAESAARASFHLPDAFIEHLKGIRDAEPQAAAPRKTRGGRTVKTAFVALAPDEARAREESAYQIIADEMRKRRQT